MKPSPYPSSPEDTRAIASLRAQNARLSAEIDTQHRQLRRLRQTIPVQKKAVAAPAPPFELIDPRRKPTAGSKVLPPLTPPLMVGRQMGAAIVAALREMTIETRAAIRGLAKDPEAKSVVAAMDAPPDGGTAAGKAQQRLEALQAKWKARFAALAEEWSRRMIVDVVAQSTAQLSIGLKDLAERTAIQSTMSLPRMRTVVQAAVQANVALIERIPGRLLGDVQTKVMSAITTGTGLADLVPYLTERYAGDARHARLVALDQIRKVTASVNATRLQALGVESYIWVHTGGERYPRHLHVQMNGKAFRYDDPPVIQAAKGDLPEIRGKPGDLISCRCIARPIVEFTKMVPVV